jgi:alpha-methylacyl-CoA racemase
MAGPLAGIRIIEFAGLGPGPFAAMMLADQGAEMIRIDRPGATLDPADPALRSRRSVTIDLGTADGAAEARALCRAADGLIEGFRPGVMERLGLGPEVLLADNPELVYGRMTGWGQDGPLAQAAGHDINYIALSGVLHTVGRAGEKPVPPINYAGDFGGGGMLLAFGMAAALLAVKMGGPGQVVDAAMTEGSSLLAGMLRWLGATGRWRDERGVNLLDGGAHFYDCYETADGKYVAIGAIEPQFYRSLLGALGLADDPDFGAQMNPAGWPALKGRLAAIFRTKSRDEWCALMQGTDVCFAPVLSLAEAPLHAHNVARHAFVAVGGMIQPAPAPRFSATPADPPRPPGEAGADNKALLGR